MSLAKLNGLEQSEMAKVNGQDIPLPNPYDLGACMWIDPKDATTLDETAGVITSISDKISSNVYTQATAGARPSLVEVGGYDCIQFTGSEWLYEQSPAGIGSTSSYILAAVFKTSSANNVNLIVCRDSGTVQSRQIGTRYTYRIHHWCGSANLITDIATQQVKLLFSGRYPGATPIKNYVNGSLEDTGANGPASLNAIANIAMGAFNDAGAGPWVGDLHEMALIQDDATDDTLTALNAYMMANNGLS